MYLYKWGRSFYKRGILPEGMQLFAKICSKSCRFLELTEAQTGADRIKKFGVKLPNVVPGSCRNTSKWFWFEWRVFKLVDWLKSRRMDIIQPYTASSQFCKFKATKTDQNLSIWFWHVLVMSSLRWRCVAKVVGKPYIPRLLGRSDGSNPWIVVTCCNIALCHGINSKKRRR